jgi:hypothetical protein
MTSAQTAVTDLQWCASTIGIVLEISPNQLHVVLPGMYFIPETEFKHIGKAM